MFLGWQYGSGQVYHLKHDKKKLNKMDTIYLTEALMFSKD